MGITLLAKDDHLSTPRQNLEVNRLADALSTRQTKTLVAGIDLIMVDLKESMAEKPGPITHHSGALVFLVEYRRDPKPDEIGCDWVQDAQAERAAVLSTETATVLANYLRVLGLAPGRIRPPPVMSSCPGWR